MQKVIVLFILSLSILAGGLVGAQQDAAVTITSPAPGAVLQNLSAISVTGTGTALFENSLVVQARDSAGQILAQQPVTTDASEVGGTGNWQTTLAVSVTPGTAGDIRAFATSAMDGSVVAEAIINVIYGTSTPPSSITISTPLSGEILPNSGSFLVRGSATNIFEGALTVQARDSAGNVLAEQATTAEGAGAGTGDWQVTLAVNVAAGTTGNIRAFSESPDGRINAEAVVNIAFGAIPNDVAITITFPTNGTVVNTAGGVDVTGTTRNIFDGNVVVQIRDGNNHVLSERSVKSSATQGEGLWQANLNAFFTASVSGSIVAFTPGVGDGGQFLSHTVFVTFQPNCAVRTDWPIYVVVRGDILNSIARRIGSSTAEIAQGNCLNNINIIEVGQPLRVPRLPVTPPPPATPTPAPQQAAVGIQSPLNGDVLDATQPIRVDGTANGLSSVVVQALDAANNVLAAQTVAVANGAWHAALSVGTPSGTSGRITAFATSVVDGSVVASASVSVTYGASQPGEASLTITLPEPDAALDISLPVTLTGAGIGLADNALAVRVLDNESRVLGEYPGALNAEGRWVLDLNIDAEPGTQGILYAYAPTPLENGAVLADAVNVTFGTPPSDSFVTISSPIPYATLTEQTFKVGGRGGGLFEGNVVVRALDADGNVLVELPTTLNATEAGGEGEWEAELVLAAPPGTRGSIVAFSTSPADGSVIALAHVPVIFGQPAPDQQSLLIASPLPDTPLAAGEVAVYGAAGQPIQSLTVQMIDADGNILASRSVAPEAGQWQTTLTLVAVDAGTTGRLVAFTIGEGGAVIASDGIAVSFTGESAAG